MPRQVAGLGIARLLEHGAVGADHQRQFVGRTPSRSSSSRPSSSLRIEHRMGIAVAREEALQAHQIGIVGRGRPAPIRHRSASISPTRRRMKARMIDLAEFGRADQQRAQMCAASNGKASAAVGAGAAVGERGAAAELADLARDLAGTVG